MIIREDTYRCEECGVEARVPTYMPAQAREEFGRLVRAKKMAGALMWFRESSHSSFIARKPALKHARAPDERCHHCGAELPGRGEVVCKECKALNLNW